MDRYQNEIIVRRIKETLSREYRMEVGHLHIELVSGYIKIFDRYNRNESLVRYDRESSHLRDLIEEIFHRFKHTAPPYREHEVRSRGMFDRFHYRHGEPVIKRQGHISLGKDMFYNSSVTIEVGKKKEEPKTNNDPYRGLISEVKEFKF